MPLLRSIIPGLCSLLLYTGCTAGSGPHPSTGFEALEDGRLRHVTSGIVLVRIAAGRFTMGAPDHEVGRDGDEFLHEVEIARDFYLGETEVTAAQWARVMGEAAREGGRSPDHPVGDVSWHRAREFVARLNASGPGWRLPSEVEWEYACRAGTSTPFSFGENIDTDHVNYDGHYPYRGAPRGERRKGALPVRSLPANAWGLYEMHGNLWEWVDDLYVFDPRAAGAGEAHRPGDPRVIRGGAFTRGAKQARCAYRDGYPPASTGDKYGLRIAWSTGER